MRVQRGPAQEEFWEVGVYLSITTYIHTYTSSHVQASQPASLLLCSVWCIEAIGVACETATPTHPEYSQNTGNH